MRCIADFEILSEINIQGDEKELKFSHPLGGYDLYLKNWSDKKSSEGAILRAHLIFDVNSLYEAKEESLVLLADALNLLSFVSNAKFEFQRLIQIFDWTPGLQEREGIIFVEQDPVLDVQEMLSESIVTAAEFFARSAVSESVGNILRWFRLAVASDWLEEQFQNFWFALELIAEIEKEPNKVNDLCPKCGGKLFCEACGTYPTHRPYPKQAIEQLIRKVAPNLNDFFAHASNARNAIMHGGQLKDIEHELPCSREHLVDLLGKITWHALSGLLEKHLPVLPMFSKAEIGITNTYVRTRIGAAAYINTVIPNGVDGEPNIESFSNFQMRIEKAGPIQKSDVGDVGKTSQS